MCICTPVLHNRRVSAATPGALRREALTGGNGLTVSDGNAPIPRFMARDSRATQEGRPLAHSFGLDPPYPNIQIDQQPDFVPIDLNRIARMIQENIGGISRHYSPGTLLL